MMVATLRVKATPGMRYLEKARGQDGRRVTSRAQRSRLRDRVLGSDGCYKVLADCCTYLDMREDGERERMLQSC